MNFAPYQDTSPELTRALSPPPPTSPRKPSPRPWSPNRGSQALPQPDAFRPNFEQQQQQQRQPVLNERDTPFARDIDLFETSLPLRMDFEACLAYLLLPPVGGALLLVLERRSDYVRFHAWQSSLVFTFSFLIHLVLSFSKFLSFALLICDLSLIAFMTLRAYRDASTVDRCELPVFGKLASGFVDDE